MVAGGFLHRRRVLGARVGHDVFYLGGVSRGSHGETREHGQFKRARQTVGSHACVSDIVAGWVRDTPPRPRRREPEKKNRALYSTTRQFY